MATGQRFYTPNFFDVDATGLPYLNGNLYFYQSGTSTPANTYADIGLTTPNPNPVPAVSSGHFGSIFLDPSINYRVQLYDQNDVQVWSFDNVGPGAGGAISNTAGIVGEVRQYAGLASTVPAGWYLCYGQAVSRTTYATAFAVLGTTWGIGDGSTTFNLPDLRGRIMAGLDNMGGVAANRITAGVCGVPGTTLGGAGGSQNAQQDTLTATSTSTVTDPGHTHPQLSGTISVLGGPNVEPVMGNNSAGFETGSATTGITVATSTTVTSGLTGTSQNVQPTAMLNSIIYLGV